MIMTTLFEISLYAAIIFGALLMFGSSVYDLRASRRRRRGGQANSLHVTVVVYAHNNATTIEACLQSIVDSGVYNSDIVVVDALSSDETNRIVCDYQRAHSDVSLRLYTKRVICERVTALHQAYYRSQRGDVVCVVDGTQRMSVSTMQVAALFDEDESLQAIQLPVVVRGASQLGVTVAYFMYQSHAIYSKAVSLVRPRSTISFGRNGCIYRVQVHKSRRLLPGHATCQYAAAYGAVEEIRSGLRVGYQLAGGHSRPWYQNGVIIFILSWSFVLCVWMMQLAATLQSSAPLLVSWLLAVLWLTIITLSDVRSSFIEKIGYILSTPILVLFVYVYIVMSYVGILLLRSMQWILNVATNAIQMYRRHHPF